ncbi:MAG: Gfo/Idh/MocA family oxidoreductase [Candidatus Latescibacterota bacterium]|nr:Gfo/Idh/MocA family oxidoreductase [Candidatus Latescibacterota bacterium]
MVDRIFRTGLVGCGRMGATIDDEVHHRPDSEIFLPYSHAAAVVACERTELVAVCDPLREKAESAAERYGVADVYESYEKMIQREELDIVCIATRPSPHAPVTIFAAENGVRGVYCEKPLCNSMAEADAMKTAIDAHGTRFNYGTQRRYVQLYRNARAMADSGDIGELQAVIAHCGASVAQWGHTHAADMLLFLAGDGEVEYVQGSPEIAADDMDGERILVDPRIEMAYVRFANGVHGYFVAAGDYEFEMSGSEGKLRTLNNGSGYTWRTTGDRGDLVDRDPPSVQIESGTLRALEDLVRAIDNDKPSKGPIEIACRSQEMILGIVESQRQGGARVELPLHNRDLTIRPDAY